MERYFFIFLWKVWGTGLSNAVDLWLVLLTQTVAGWFVVRTHRAQPFPPLFAYLICSLFWFFGPPLWLKIIMDWDRIVPWSRASVLYNILADIFLTTAGILLGGILAHPKKPRSVPSNPNVT